MNINVTENTQTSKTINSVPQITKGDLRKSFWLWNSMAQAMYSFERMQASGFVSAMIPIMKRLYPNNKTARDEMAIRHMEFFNTEIWMIGGVIVGITISMEEERAKGVPIHGEDISAVKTSLMGPLAGIGDTLRQGTLIPIIGSIAISFGLVGNFLGPILYMILTLCINYSINWFLFSMGYKKGKEGIAELFASGKLEKMMTLATTVGAIAIGGLAATTVKVVSSLEFHLGSNKLVMQSLLDKILLNIVPFTIVMFAFWLITKKKLSATKVLLILIVLSILFVLIGFI